MTASTTPAARPRGKRTKWYAGGGLVLLLMFLLGDRVGMFRSDDGGAPTGTRSAESGSRTERPVPGPGAPNGVLARDPRGQGEGGTPPDLPGKAAAPTKPAPKPKPGAGAGSAAGPDPDRQPDPDPEAAERRKTKAPVGTPKPAARDRSEAARMDETMGLIARFEQALTADHLGRLAALVDQVRQNPVVAPNSLAVRWKQVQARADAALRCGDRLRQLVRNGEILGARRLLAPILEAGTPAWMRERLDAAAAGFGWPALTPARSLKSQAITGATRLAKGRRVRFVRDGDLQEGELWRCADLDATVRIRGADGFTFPVVPRRDVEPVGPEPEEAFAQGRVAVRSGDAQGVLLWACHFHEHGREETSKKLWALLSPVR